MIIATRQMWAGKIESFRGKKVEIEGTVDFSD